MKTSEVYGGSNAYLKAEDLGKKAVRATIESVEAKEFQQDDGRTVTKLVVHFFGKDKALVLNRTNSATIERVTQTDETDDWIGWSIVLYGTEVPYGKKIVPAIRVDDRPGTATKPERLQRREATKPAVPRREPGDDDEPPMVIEDDDSIPF